VNVGHWPSTGWPLSVPSVSVGEARWAANQGTSRGSLVEIDFGYPDAEMKLDKSKTVNLPDELYLRELHELDLKDSQAILLFANAYGWLGWTAFYDEEFDPLQPFTREGYAYSPDLHLDESKVGLQREANSYFTARLKRELLSGDLLKIQLGSEGLQSLQHLDAFRLHVYLLRDMTRIWGAIAGAWGWDDVFSQWETPADWYFLPEPLDSSDEGIGNATRLVMDLVNLGLERLHPQVAPGATARVNAGPRATFSMSTFGALCLQLANHVVEGAVYSRCDYAKCSSLFVRQRGRAKGDRHRRSVVLYCSKSCAQKQARLKMKERLQKDLERRQAEASVDTEQSPISDE
jgi:hypothetical protein